MSAKSLLKKALPLGANIARVALSVSAQEEGIFYYNDAKGTQNFMRDFIDRKAMIYRFDGDSEDECTMEMKNYKKNGNTDRKSVV